jgi:hypothetical protein
MTLSTKEAGNVHVVRKILIGSLVEDCRILARNARIAAMLLSQKHVTRIARWCTSIWSKEMREADCRKSHRILTGVQEEQVTSNCETDQERPKPIAQ